MSLPLLPKFPEPGVSVHAKMPTATQTARLSHLLVLVLGDTSKLDWHRLPEGTFLQRLVAQGKTDPGTTVSTHLPGRQPTGVSLGFLASGDEARFDVLTLARKLSAAALGTITGAASIGVAVLASDENAARDTQLASDCLSALLAAALQMPALRKKPAAPVKLAQVRLFGLAQRPDLTRLQSEAHGTNLARWLSAMPSNHLRVREYRQRLRHLADEQGWAMRVFDIKALKKKGAGAFLAVAQASEHQDDCIVRLRYRPAKARGKPICLVGKGVVFDTGGVNVKPATYMQDMNGDMQGSAVALGALLALSKMKVRQPVDVWLALVENSINAAAYKPQDVVRASNGLTIEVIHTDAEGRMALADTLAMAAAEKPAIIMDFATLTGTCVMALTTRYSGVFSNREALHAPLVQAGKLSGERVWPFPMDTDLDALLDSETADMKQCLIDSKGDHILAARLLSRFAGNDTPWVHVDLSASSNSGGLAHIPSATTGFGVRFALQFLLDQDWAGALD